MVYNRNVFSQFRRPTSPLKARGEHLSLPLPALGVLGHEAASLQSLPLPLWELFLSLSLFCVFLIRTLVIVFGAHLDNRG